MSLANFHDTIVAESTPSGRGALAIVRLSGPDAIGIVARLAVRRAEVLTALGGGSVYTELMAGGELLDDVVASIRRGPHSVTGEDVVELSCHGSGVIVERIIAATCKSGARRAEPGEFSERGFWNGKLELEEVERIPLRIHAGSEAELRGVERGLKEKFDVLNTAFEGLISLVARVNAEIDFGDSDEIVIPDLRERVSEVRSQLAALTARASRLLANSGVFNVAFVGAPNVGKSSLFNALLRMERSIVSEHPGTTRDYVDGYLDLGGFRIRLIDTAGSRAAGDAIESRGIALGQDAALDADLVFRVSEPGCRELSVGSSEVVLHNKVDVDGWSDGLCVSALTGAGLESLLAFVEERAATLNSEFSRPRLLQGEREVIDGVVRGLSELDIESGADLLAEELAELASRLGTLIGKSTSVESLDYIFRSMCIGK